MTKLKAQRLLMCYTDSFLSGRQSLYRNSYLIILFYNIHPLGMKAGLAGFAIKDSMMVWTAGAYSGFYIRLTGTKKDTHKESVSERNLMYW